MGWMIWGSVPTRSKTFFSSNGPDHLWDSSSHVFTEYWGSLPQGLQLRCAVDHPPPHSAKVKNEWTHTSASFTCLHGMNRNNFTFMSIKVQIRDVYVYMCMYMNIHIHTCSRKTHCNFSQGTKEMNTVQIHFNQAS